MEQNNFIYEEKIKNDIVFLLVPFLAIAIVFGLNYFGFKNISIFTDVKIVSALGFVLLYWMFTFFVILQYNIGIKQDELIVRKNRFMINQMNNLEIVALEDIFKKYGTKTNSSMILLQPGLKLRKPSKAVMFQQSDSYVKVVVATNNPDQVYNLLLKYGAKAKTKEQV